MTDCVKEKHPIPKNWAFESGGAVFQGGICPDCGKLVQGKFLGNVWTKESETTIMVPDLNCPEGKELAEKCTLDIIKAGNNGDTLKILERFHEECERLPLKKEKIGLLEGYDLPKFQKKGWIIKPI